MHGSDADLVAATRLGDDQAFETLYHRYHRRIAAYVVGMVKDHQRAEDVTQEIFLSALRRMRATDREIAFKPWIYEIAKNACIDQFRRARRTDEVSYDVAADDGGSAALVSGRLGPDEAAESRKQLDDLCGALRGLSDSHHQILVLRELEGRSYDEIGARMNLSRPAVESTLFRARKRLSEEYGELVSGERCRKVQQIIELAAERSLGARDRRTMARHLSHCQPCRRVAAMSGLADVMPARTGIRGKIAAVLPLPAFLRDRWLGAGASPARPPGDGGAGIAAWMHAAAPMAENASGWGKAVAATVAVVVAGAGGAVATQSGGEDGAPHDAPAAVAAAPPVPVASAPAARTTTVAAAASRGGGAVARQTGRAALGTTTRSARRAVRTNLGAVGVQGRSVTSDPSPAGTPAAQPKQAGPAGDPPASASPAAAKRTTSAASAPSAAVVGDTASTVPSSPSVSQTAQAVSGVVSGTTQAVQGVVAGTTETVQGVVSATTQTVQGVTSATTQVVQGVAAGTTQTVQGVVDGTTQAVQGVVGQTANGVQGILTGLGKPSTPTG